MSDDRLRTTRMLSILVEKRLANRCMVWGREVSFACRHGIAAGVVAFTMWLIFVLAAYVAIVFLTLTFV